jgi:hypothetical protein
MALISKLDFLLQATSIQVQPRLDQFSTQPPPSFRTQGHQSTSQFQKESRSDIRPSLFRITNAAPEKRPTLFHDRGAASLTEPLSDSLPTALHSELRNENCEAQNRWFFPDSSRIWVAATRWSHFQAGLRHVSPNLVSHRAN